MSTLTDTDIDTEFDIIVKEEASLDDSDGPDHDRMTHGVHKDLMMYALDTGNPVRAICGKMWKPRPDKAGQYPMCPTCDEYLKATRGGDKE